MKRFIISLISTFTLLLAFSCARMEELANMKVYADDDPVTCDFTLEVENPLVETKATYMPSTLNKITNVNVWIYRDGTLLSDYSFYKSNYASDPHLPMMFPSASASYNVYLFANVGQKTAPANEANIGTVSFSVNDYSSFIYNGFPMANSVLNYTPSGGQSISIKRLVGVYNISLAQSSDKITWTVTGGQMKNVPKVVRPFSTLEGFEGYASKIQSASERNESGDLLSTADKTALNNGGSVSLYFLENCQGQLLPGNTDYRLKKLPDNHPAKDLCTYLQLDCSASTPTANYSNIHYNFYLGEDATTDFSVRRSTQHAFSLELSSDIISTEEEWFIEPDVPSIKRTLRVSTKQPYNGSANAAAVDGNGWGEECPSCGAKFGSDDYRLEIFTTHANYGDVYRVHCSNCGYNSTTYGFNGASGSNKYNHYIKDFDEETIHLWDFLGLQLYVITDLKWNDTWRAYIKSTGTTSGNGFSVSRTAGAGASIGSAIEAVNIISVTDNNTTVTNPASSSEDKSDYLVIESYDGLIHYEYPLYHHGKGIPISFQGTAEGFKFSTPSESKMVSIYYAIRPNTSTSLTYKQMNGYHSSSTTTGIASISPVSQWAPGGRVGAVFSVTFPKATSSSGITMSKIACTNRTIRNSMYTEGGAYFDYWYGYRWNGSSWIYESDDYLINGNVLLAAKVNNPYFYNASTHIKLYFNYITNINRKLSSNNLPYSAHCDLMNAFLYRDQLNNGWLMFDSGVTASASNSNSSLVQGKRFAVGYDTFDEGAGSFETRSIFVENSGYWEYVQIRLKYRYAEENAWNVDDNKNGYFALPGYTSVSL